MARDNETDERSYEEAMQAYENALLNPLNTPVKQEYELIYVDPANNTAWRATMFGIPENDSGEPEVRFFPIERDPLSEQDLILTSDKNAPSRIALTGNNDVATHLFLLQRLRQNQTTNQEHQVRLIKEMMHLWHKQIIKIKNKPQASII